MLYCFRCRTLFHSENSDSVVTIFPKLCAPVTWHIWLMLCLLDNVLWAHCDTRVYRIHSGWVHYLHCWLVTPKLTQIHSHNFVCEYLLKCATASTVLVWCCCRIILQKIKRENMSYHCDNLEVCHFTEASSSIRYNIIKNLVHTVEKQWFH